MLSDLGHASPIEHASFTFDNEGVSRTLSHTITRHRIASFSVQSQRYVRLDDFRYDAPLRSRQCLLRSSSGDCAEETTWWRSWSRAIPSV